MQGFVRRTMIAGAMVLLAAGERAHAQAPATGPADAPVTIVQFADFSSEPSARLSFMLEALVDAYPNAVRVVFKHVPPASNPNANVPLTHDAALAAGAQGKFWEMADLIFGNQGRATHDDMAGMARQLGLDMRRFLTDLDTEGGGQYQSAIEADQQEAVRLGIKAPACTLNGEILRWPVTLQQLKAAVDKRLAGAPPAAKH